MTAADELHPGRRKLVLSFDLPRGSYATLIVKRITNHRGTEDTEKTEERRQTKEV